MSKDQARVMDFIKNSPTRFLPLREKYDQSFGRFSPIRLKENRIDSEDRSNVSSRLLENLNNSFNRYSALNLSGRKETKDKDTEDVNNHSSSFNRYLALNLSGRKEAKEVKVKIDNLKSALTKDISNIKEAFISISSPQSYKRKHSNLINEDREEFDAVDLTIDLCDTIIHDDNAAAAIDIPIKKKRKLTVIEATELPSKGAGDDYFSSEDD
eukprot:GFUD01022102.1.p1 GENE.GFUD01022102.1~~GFUD01022102.1.p1  ORF type:complete len:212 (-),score=73.22 GFUD01022102.1:110-745(-)